MKNVYMWVGGGGEGSMQMCPQQPLKIALNFNASLATSALTTLIIPPNKLEDFS